MSEFDEPRILVVVSGGVVQSVTTTGGPLEVTIVDYDNPSMEVYDEDSAAVDEDSFDRLYDEVEEEYESLAEDAEG